MNRRRKSYYRPYEGKRWPPVAEGRAGPAAGGGAGFSAPSSAR